MVPNVLFYQLFVVTLVVICLLIHVWWRDAPRASPPTVLTPDTPRRKRPTKPKPFPGFIHLPLCAACVQRTDKRPTTPGAPPYGQNTRTRFPTEDYAPALLRCRRIDFEIPE